MLRWLVFVPMFFLPILGLIMHNSCAQWIIRSAQLSVYITFFDTGAVEQQTTFQPGHLGRDFLYLTDGLSTLWWKSEDERTQRSHGYVETTNDGLYNHHRNQFQKWFSTLYDMPMFRKCLFLAILIIYVNQ